MSMTTYEYGPPGLPQLPGRERTPASARPGAKLSCGRRARVAAVSVQHCDLSPAHTGGHLSVSGSPSRCAPHPRRRAPGHECGTKPVGQVMDALKPWLTSVPIGVRQTSDGASCPLVHGLTPTADASASGTTPWARSGLFLKETTMEMDNCTRLQLRDELDRLHGGPGGYDVL